jgi:hypothetical protein
MRLAGVMCSRRTRCRPRGATGRSRRLRIVREFGEMTLPSVVEVTSYEAE